MDDNPYQTPGADLLSKNSAIQTGCSIDALQELSGTRPWVLFLSIAGLFGVALAILGSVGMIFAGIAFSAFYLVAAFYLVSSLIFGLSFLMLWRFGRAIARLQQSPEEKDLRHALFLHRRFWKVFGIGCIVAVVLVAAMVILAPMMMFSDFDSLESEPTFESTFPEEMDLSELEEL